MKHTVAILFGGQGREYEISLASAYAVLREIDRSLFSPLPIGITPAGDWYIYRGQQEKIKDGTWRTDSAALTPTYPVRLHGRRGFLCEGEILPVCAVLPVLHGDRGEDGVIQGALATAGLPFVGADVEAGAITSDKIVAKILAEHAGVPTVPWVAVRPEETPQEAAERAVSRLSFPLFVKPAGLGSSIGAAPAENRTELLAALAAAREVYDGPILVERYLTPRLELECAYLGTDKPERLSPLGQIDCPDGFYSYREKYAPESEAQVLDTAEVSAEVQKTVHGYARRLLPLFGIQDLCRLDFFLGGEGRIYFNEVNTFPGMTPISLYPRLLSRMGLGMRGVLTRLINAAMRRGLRAMPPCEGDAAPGDRL